MERMGMTKNLSKEILDAEGRDYYAMLILETEIQRLSYHLEDLAKKDAEGEKSFQIQMMKTFDYQNLKKAHQLISQNVKRYDELCGIFSIISEDGENGK